MDDHIVERVVDLPATAEEVWSALTEPRRLSSWVGGEVVELDVRPGGRGVVRRADGVARRVVVEAGEPFRRLALRWWPFEDEAAALPGGRGSSVEFLLEESADGCRLRVRERAPMALPGLIRTTGFDRVAGLARDAGDTNLPFPHTRAAVG